MTRRIIIGSRGSDLALWQAKYVMKKLEDIGVVSELKIIRTKGDEVTLSFDKMEGKGFFTKEIEDALLSKEIDLAVHSHKDLPTTSPPGLLIAAVSTREDPSELLLINRGSVDEKNKFSLKNGALIGTSSARRKSQLLAWRPDVKIEDLRGNVPTRIKKLKDNKYDAILIASAGVSRLEIALDDLHVEKLDPHEFIPAPAQGVLAMQVRESDEELIKVVGKINDAEASETTAVERKVMNLFQGGCQLPLGVICEKDENENGETIFKVRAAKAEAWDRMPKYIYLESKKTTGLAEKVQAVLTASDTNTVKKLFISRDERKNDLFKRCLEAHGYNVYAQSLIEIKQVPMRRYVKCDWVFFSSKNAVKHFFDQKPDVEGSKFAAVGKATADEIRKYGRRAEFIGSSDDTRMTGKKFSALVGRKTILFPQAKVSMKTIQLQLKQEQIIDVVVYETIKQVSGFRFQVSEMDVLAFTSPSNVDTFHEKYKILPGQKVVAMGDATANALKKYGVRPDKMSISFDDLGLVQAVFALDIK